MLVSVKRLLICTVLYRVCQKKRTPHPSTRISTDASKFVVGKKRITFQLSVVLSNLTIVFKVLYSKLLFFFKCDISKRSLCRILVRYLADCWKPRSATITTHAMHLGKVSVVVYAKRLMCTNFRVQIFDIYKFSCSNFRMYKFSEIFVDFVGI